MRTNSQRIDRHLCHNAHPSDPYQADTSGREASYPSWLSSLAWSDNLKGVVFVSWLPGNLLVP